MSSSLKEWNLLIKDWIVSASVGILPNELKKPQNIHINIRCRVRAPQPQEAQSIDEVVCYAQLKQGIDSLITSRHFYLLENLAEEMAALCLKDPRVQEAYICIEKAAITSQGPHFGIELTRFQKDEETSVLLRF